MAKVNALTHGFAYGEISRAALNRVDKEAIRLYAERQENILPYTIGKGLMRPGTQLLGTTANGNRPRYLSFIKAVNDTALLELTASTLRVWIDDALLTRSAVTSTVADGGFDTGVGWTLTTSGGASATISNSQLTLQAPARGGKAAASQLVTTSNVGSEHALRIDVANGPVTLRVGGSDGGDEFIAETNLDTGIHSLAFIPTGATGAGIDSFTKLMLHCDGVDASTTFTDSSASAHTVTANGNAQVDTAQQKFGTASALFDGVNDWLSLDGSADFVFGTDDFSIDMWIRLSATGLTQYIYDSRPSGTGSGNYPALFVSSANVISYAVGSTTRITGFTSLSAGVWYHVALARSGATTYLFLNGVLQGTLADVRNYIVGVSRPAIGTNGGTTSASEFNGWIDEIRVSKGIARWTSSFTPSSVAYGAAADGYWIQFSTKREIAIIVNSVQVEAAGVVELPAPWAEEELREIRVDESLDVIFMGHENWQQRKIERRGSGDVFGRSWSLVLYRANDGPFTVARTANVRLKPAATRGNTTLTAESNFFRPTHVGALFQINHNKFAATFALGAENTFSDAYRLSGIGAENDHSVVVTGTFVGTLTLQHSFEGPDDGWIDTTDTIAAPGTITSTLAATFDNQIIWVRVGFNAGQYTSGTATVAPTYGGWHGIGVCRVTSYVSPTVVNVEVLSDFKNTFYTDDWLEGEWSDERGWPSAVGFNDGRLWWARDDQFWGSESNAYYKFNLTTVGDAGSIQRSIAVGGSANKTNWILGLLRLIFGTDQQEISAKSSSFDAPITPTELTLKPASKAGSANLSPLNLGDKGVFVHRSGKYLYEVTLDGNSQDYASKDLTRLNEEIGDSGNPDLYDDGFVELAMQISPMPYVWALREDGIACNTLYNPGEEARGIFRVITGALSPLDSARPSDRIISVVTLPTFDEDSVYFAVERTISDGAGGTTQAFYLEKMAKHSEVITRVYNSTTRKVEAKNGLKLLDSFITTTGTSIVGQVITGLTHLLGRTDVMIIGQAVDGLYGPSTDLYTVSASGTITTLQAFSGTLCVGVGYAGIYQSSKLAYGAQKGTALTQVKRVETLGMVVLDTHPDSIRITPDFALDPADWDELPRLNTNLVEEDATAAIPRTIEEDMFPFPGQWDTDSRVCLYLRPGYSACLSALVIGINTAE